MKRVGLSLLVCALFLSWAVVASAAVPHLVNYQGKLTDKDGVSLEGTYSMNFRIFDSLSGGTLLWQETQGVLIQKGIFNVLLGGVNNLNLPFDTPYFLEIVVGGEVMSPRQRITSAGYAVRAETAETLPANVLLICKDSCPAGYSRVGALDGKFLVGGAAFNAAAGGSNSHAHSAGTFTAGSHTHSGTTDGHTLTPGEMPSHSHGGIYGQTWYGASGGSGAQVVQHSNPGNTGDVGGGQAHSHTLTLTSGPIAVSGASDAADNRPEYATVVICQKNQ